MKKLLYIVLIISSINSFVLGQSCLPDGIAFSTQQQIDDFVTDYPGCTEIEGDVCIGDCDYPYSPSNITNLNGLSQLTSIGGDLNIYNNAALTSLSGLENITSIGGNLLIYWSDNLTSLSGLENLTSVDGALVMQTNPQLTSLSGLNNLTSIKGGLYIRNNRNMINLSGLENLTSLFGRIYIEFNNALTNLSGLENLNSNVVYGEMVISDNPQLTSLSGLENITYIGEGLRIRDNDALENLSGLENLDSIGLLLEIERNAALTSISALGNLNNAGAIWTRINENTALTSLSGLENLSSIIGDLVVNNNTALTSLSGLENITSIGGGLSIGGTTQLTSLSGLENITSIGGGLYVGYHAALTSLSGLENITSIGGELLIKNNAALTSISGIQNIDPTTIESTYSGNKDLEIYGNPNLSECEVQSICGFLELPGKTKKIHDNMVGCNSVTEVENACQVPPPCTNLIIPDYGATGVSTITDISWAVATDATGYRLTVGTSSGGADIENNIDVGSDTTYNVGQLPCNTEIFVTIVPYNAAGDATGCTEGKFTTENVIADAGSDVTICDEATTQLHASGGTTYSWSPTTGLSNPNIATPTASPTTTTTYTVTVSNDGRCEQTDEVTVTVGGSVIPNASATAETGNDYNDGTAMCYPNGGTPPYTYNWSNNETTQTITGLAPGNYTVTVTDDNGCTGEQTVNVAEYVCQTITLTDTITNTLCHTACDGSIKVTPTGGTAPYTYAWSNGQTTQTATGLCAGSYTVTVTDSKDCRVISDSYTVVAPDILLANASSADETGNDFEDGTATCAPTGGTSPYTYEWSNGATTQTITGLAPGSYTITVTDDNNCTAAATVTVGEFVCPTLSVETTVSDVSCFGLCDGVITIDEVVNGVAPFTYQWHDGQNGNSIDNLCENDIYAVTITDAHNCEVVEYFTIFQPQELVVNATATDETANNAQDGTATANPSGGTEPYAYAWSNGQTTKLIQNLASGSYTVTVTDDNGCTAEETVTVVGFDCPELTLQSSQANNLCYNDCEGQLSITDVINGESPYSYEWSDGQTSQTATGLCAGEYFVTVTDVNNCSVVSSMFIITQADAMTATATSTNETSYNANDGTATVDVSGGTPSYTYQWSTGQNSQTVTGLAPGTYSVTVTDVNDCEVVAEATIEAFVCPTLTVEYDIQDVDCYDNCNGTIEINDIDNAVYPVDYEWSNGKTTAAISGLCAGDYTVTITDADNCSVTKSFAISEPEELFANASANDETANDNNDGTAIAEPTGGTSPYYYEWSNSETSQSIVNLEPGDYTVTVTDFNDCESIETVTVNEFSCPTLTVISTQDNVSCFDRCDGSIIIDEVTNGTAPFDYEWSNGESGSSVDNLCEGDYAVTITDHKNCEIIKSFTITQPTQLIANAASTDETYNDANDGTATCAPTGGTTPYEYEWSNGATAQSISGLAPGSYSVTVTDGNGCTATESVSVAEFGCQGLEIELTRTDISCNGQCDGRIEITGVSNGAAPFTYTWNTGANTAIIDSLCTGSYSVTIVDANNCNIYGTYEISEPAILSANAVSTNETANNANDGAATSNPTGGTSPYSFAWSTGDTTQAISGLAPGAYTVTVTDFHSCISIDTVTIGAYICPGLVINSQFTNASCYGVCDGSIAILSVENSAAPLAYAWNTGATSASLSNICAGEYVVTITDANNCSVVDTFTITQPDEIIINIDSTRDVWLELSGFIFVSTNDNGNYIFEWSGPNGFSANTEDIDSLSDFGCYTLKVTDTITNCSIDSTICLEDKTATYDLEFGNINIYPNPTKDYFVIDFTDSKLNKADIEIFDLSGKKQLELQKQSSDKVLQVNPAILNSGLYLIKIKSEKFGTSFRKVVINR